MSTKYIIGVVGNPNCGKTTLFNALTGAKQRVGNWPGVTVERKTGRYGFQDIAFELVDLPGTYSLDVAAEGVSIDEQIARDYVAEREADLIVNIVDASNLERNLYLTSQLLEMKVPMLVALNMMDVARERGHEVDAAGLARQLDCPVIPIVAASGEGVSELKTAILEAARHQRAPALDLTYAGAIEKAIAQLLPVIESRAQTTQSDPRWLAVRLLEGDTLARKIAGADIAPQLNALQAETEQALGDDIDISLADARYGFVNKVTSATVKRKGQIGHSMSDKIDRIVLNRWFGIPIFLLAMHFMFMFTINIGGSFIDFFDIVSGAIFVDGFSELLKSIGSPEWLTVLLANGVGGGIQVVATFIPIVGFLFLFLSALEDSGYMARAAFVMDRFLRGIGLPGKSFVPMIVGFGCTVPAVMATRTLEQERDRFITVAMSPFMSCGARLPVYALFAAAFFAAYGQNIVFLLYLIGIGAAILTGLILKNTLLRGDVTPFVMELPPYHIPTLKGILLRTWDRTKGFVIRAGRVIVPMVLVLNILNSVGTDGTFGNEDSDKSVLSEIGRTISPLFSPFGLDEDNWPASVGIFTGLLAKEAVVGTLNSLYTNLGEQTEKERLSQNTPKPMSWRADMTEEELAPATQDKEEVSFDMLGAIKEGLATIPANIGDAMGSWLDPLGLNIGDVEDQTRAAEEQDVAVGTFGAMQQRFDGAAGAFAYLLFILLYIPCVAAISAVYRETTPRWALFVAAWTTGLAYTSATLFYQAATFAQHPGTSTAWIAGMIAVFIGSIVAMRFWGQTQIASPASPQQA
ncbi:MAG: Fe(2+) transporter permease subunit FeoB [Gammaproteobacteria bacterium]|nr:Fe(2+) transporter permease subunit FeoB [Gammaproteobacteria bacterium]MCP5458664.1 Fe(2+) transporter permease subunit FeoB [Gammaproteobacteria bacterium]